MLSNKIIALFICLFTIFTVEAQLDSVKFDVVVIEDTKISPSEGYKKQQVDSATLDRYEFKSIGEVLQNETPLFVKSYGQGAVSSVSFRGTGSSHTQLYWNGMPVNSMVLGMSDVSLFQSGLVNDVEVHYGLSSLVDGSGGLGGSVQLNNAAKWENKFSVKTSFEVASYGSYNSDLQLNIGNDKIHYEVGGLYKTSANDFEYVNVSKKDNPIETQQNAGYVQQGFYQNLFYKLSKKDVISLKLNYFNSDRHLPKLITQDYSDETLNDKSLRSILEWQRIERTWLLTTKFGYWNEVLDYQYPMNGIVGHFTVNNNMFDVNFKKYLKADIKFNLVYNAYSSMANSLNFTGKESILKNSIMGSLQKTFAEKHFVNLLIRQEHINGKFYPVLPSFGLKSVLYKNIAVRANIARSFRYPSLNDLYWTGSGTMGNADLKPELGWGSEAGIVTEQQLGNVKLSGEVTGYYSKISNWIIWLPQVNSNVWTPQNKKLVENKGFETMLSGEIKRSEVRLTIKGIHSYTLVTNLLRSSENDESEGKQLIYVPKQQLKGSVMLNIKRFEFSYRHQYIDRRYITTDNNWYMPNYQLGDVMLSYFHKLKKHNVKLSFAVNNVWNRSYQSIAWRPMPGRNYSVKLTYQFNK